MNLHRLRCFMKVVELGSITKAAAALQMTQPPLSILIRKFEEELGVTLFNRTGRYLELTPSGTFLYQRGKELLDVSENTERELVEYHEGVRGTVKMGCITSANLFILPNVIKRIHEETPNIVTHVREGNSSYILKELRSLSIDFGIVRTAVRAEDIDAKVLLTEPLLLALPPDHPLCEKVSIEIADLENERFLLPTTSHGQGIADDIIEACQNSGFTPNIVYWGTETLPTLLMVMKGAGICFAPSCYKQFNSPNLPVLRPIAFPVLETKLSIITLRNRFMSSVSKRFLTITEEVVQEMTNISKS